MFGLPHGILAAVFGCILCSGCGTLAHQHIIGINHHGRVDLWSPYSGVATDLGVLRELKDDHSVPATIAKTYFVLDCPLSAMGDTLYLPRWAILKQIHKNDPLPPWLERDQDNEQDAAHPSRMPADESNELVDPEQHAVPERSSSHGREGEHEDRNSHDLKLSGT